MVSLEWSSLLEVQIQALSHVTSQFEISLIELAKSSASNAHLLLRSGCTLPAANILVPDLAQGQSRAPTQISSASASLTLGNIGHYLPGFSGNSNCCQPHLTQNTPHQEQATRACHFSPRATSNPYSFPRSPTSHQPEPPCFKVAKESTFRLLPDQFQTAAYRRALLLIFAASTPPDGEVAG